MGSYYFYKYIVSINAKAKLMYQQKTYFRIIISKTKEIKNKGFSKDICIFLSRALYFQSTLSSYIVKLPRWRFNHVTILPSH